MVSISNWGSSNSGSWSSSNSSNWGSFNNLGDSWGSNSSGGVGSIWGIGVWVGISRVGTIGIWVSSISRVGTIGAGIWVSSISIDSIESISISLSFGVSLGNMDNSSRVGNISASTGISSSNS